MTKGTFSSVAVTRAILATDAVVPDTDNRRIVEDEDFEALSDSIRVLGLLQPLQVWRRPDGTHRLIDGERRWQAARKIGLAQVPCDVWPAETDRRRVAVAGLVLNEHRRAHGCIHVARRLRQMKNDGGLSLAEVAEQAGLPLDRVKTYSTLLQASDDVITFLEENEVPLKVAAEIVRYQRATNEAKARRLIAKYKETPLTVQAIIALRKRDAGQQSGEGEEKTAVTEAARKPAARLVERLEKEVRKRPEVLGQLDKLLQKLGYRIVRLTVDAKQGA